jgi:hypothetical protein
MFEMNFAAIYFVAYVLFLRMILSTENPSSTGYGRDKPRGPPPAEDGVNKTSLIFFTLAAALANFGYVFASGLVRVSVMSSLGENVIFLPT